MDVSGATQRFWQVQAVFACDEDEAPGFAYTMGLAAQGHPELHMWDRPSHGDDPGADFALSSADLCTILNGYADEWVAGSLHVGDVREISLDDGLTRAVVTFGEPVDAAEVEALGARPAPVIPLAWSLHRPERGAAVAVMDDARAGYELDVRTAAALCDRLVEVNGAHLPGPTIDFSVDRRYGPLSAVVEAYALAIASTDRIELLVTSALAAEVAGRPRALMGMMGTMSRLSGRDEQLAEAWRLAERTMRRLEMRRVWRDYVASASAEYGQSIRETGAELSDLVGTGIRCALAGIVLDDVLPDEMVLASQGPIRSALSPSGTDPGPRWRCSAEAERILRRVFASLHTTSLLQLADDMCGPVESLLEDDLLIVQGRALTRAAAPPPVVDMLRTSYRSIAAIAPLRRHLTTFAQLVAVVVDGEFDLDDDRAATLASILGWLGEPAWTARRPAGEEGSGFPDSC